MPYRFVRERLDYSDFASGRVFHSLPGRTAFPVRLADELFQRCLALRPPARRDEPVTLYDPCCGGGLLLATLAYLHWPALRAVVGSDADPEAVALARRNLALLTPEGLAERRASIAALHERYGKPSHADALASADRLAERLRSVVQDRPLPTRAFQADALDPADLLAHLGPASVDLVVTDVPYGHASTWHTAGAGTDAGAGAGADGGEPGDAPSDPIGRLLGALHPVLAPDAVVAIVSDKSQRARHERYRQVGKLQVGKRRATFLSRLA